MTKLLYLTTLFPNTVDTQAASFNRQQMLALARHADIDVVAPVPWPQALRRSSRLKPHDLGPLRVRHPCYFYVPGLATGAGRELPYLRSVEREVAELARGGGFDRVFASWLYPDGWVGAHIARQLDVPFYLKVHGSDVNRLIPGTDLARRSLTVVSDAEKVFCVSRALMERLTALGASEDKTALLYNGVDRSVFKPGNREEARRRLGIPAETKLILYVGNIKADKGLVELAEALSRLIGDEANASLRLVAIGDGPFLASWMQLVERLGVSDRVELPGRLPLDAIAGWMAACSVLCLPSYAEGMPNVLIEGISVGAKIVATAVGGIPELAAVAGGITLIAPRSVGDLAEALSAVLAEDALGGVPSPWWSWEENAKRLADHMGL